MTEQTERDLIGAFRTGRREAFDALFEASRRQVEQLALQVLRNKEAARDVQQEVFLRAYAELARWRGEARLGTWLYRTTRNVCFERIRLEHKQRRIRERKRHPVPAPPPEKRVLARETLQAIHGAVRKLPPQQRAIFMLKQYNELRFREIARLLKITEGGVKASYHKALLSLREMLRPWAPRMARSV